MRGPVAKSYTRLNDHVKDLNRINYKLKNI